MTEIVTTGKELYESVINSRGGAECLSAEEIRIAHALTAQLARKPSEIDTAAVERLAAMLPTPRRRAQAGPQVLTVRFVDSTPPEGRNEEGRLQARITELEQQLTEARAKLAQQQAAAPSAPAAAPGAQPARDNVIPMHGDGSASWAALAAVNSHLMGNPGGVLFDASDPDGRRSGKL